MLVSGQIFTRHENQWKNDPADRLIMVREGFSFWALLLTPLWCIANRLWLALLCYLVGLFVLMQLSDDFSPDVVLFVLMGVQFWFGFNGNDLIRWGLKRRGYIENGVICATSRLAAEQRAFTEFMGAHAN